MQHYQINVNNDMQNKKNQSHITNLTYNMSIDKRRIKELESELYLTEKQLQKTKNDYECAMETITILYNRIKTLRKQDIDDYYYLLNLIKKSTPSIYYKLLTDCDPNRYIFSIDQLDDALTSARRFMNKI